jgi:hypothetical protein
MKHTFLFVRQEGLSGITNAAVLTIDYAVAVAGVADALEAFKKGVSQWVAETSDGRRCWEESSENLNIGDLLNEDINDVEFQTIMSQHNVVILRMCSIEHDATEAFDLVLATAPEVPSAYVVWAAAGDIETFPNEGKARHALEAMHAEFGYSGKVFTDRAEAIKEVTTRTLGELQRRDEKHGLYGDKQDPAN